MFKKLLSICLVTFFAFILLSAFDSENNKPLFSRYSNEFEVYLLSSSSEAQIVKCDVNTYKNLTNVRGESCFFANADESDVEKILLDFSATVLFTETVDGITNYYAYSPNIKYRLNVLGNIINLHIARNQRNIKLGSPIIFGGY